MVVIVDDRGSLRIRKGAAKTFLFTVNNTDGTARVLTGETILFSFRSEWGDSATVYTKTLTGVETGSVFASGIAALNVVATDFDDVTIPVGVSEIVLAWSATLTTAGGTKYALDYGGKGGSFLVLEQVA